VTDQAHFIDPIKATAPREGNGRSATCNKEAEAEAGGKNTWNYDRTALPAA